VLFKILGSISDVETIASGRSIRERRRLRKNYGGQRWRKLKGTATVKLADGTICYAELYWYEARRWHKGIQDKADSGNPMKRIVPQFVVCVENRGYAASLELLKLYQAIPDEVAAKLHQIRVIDESGEDYLYPEEYFVPVQFPQAAEKVVRRASARG
jgi:hypothetical protein